MSRIGERISRISSAIVTVKCPECHQDVVPAGESCPECDFPLSRYAIRIKWFRVFFVGIVLLMMSVALSVLAALSDLGGWFGWTLRVTAGAGLLAFTIGLAGIAIGGRHGPGRTRQSSGWSPPGGGE